jgi:REP element-mobilizing transposase RayT
MSYAELLKGRVSIPSQIYFITTVTSNRIAYFSDFHLARLTVAEMRRLDEEGYVQSIAWVLMPDHLHWLIQLSEKQGLSKVAQRFKARSAQSLNKSLQRKGAIWQKAYYDHAVRREEDLQEIVDYIIANPLRKGLVSRIEDYPLWDSIYL